MAPTKKEYRAKDDGFRTLLAAAVLAPSGDNTQPWQFFVRADEGRIAVAVDEAKDPSPMNAGQRMERIAVGAALENVLYTAASNGWEVEMEEPAGTALASIRLRGAGPASAALPNPVLRRATNRRWYDRRPLSEALLQKLDRQTTPLGGVTTHWICDRDRLTALAALVGRADALMFGEPSMRRAFLSKVRFDAPSAAEVEEGLSLASLELLLWERLALRLTPKLPDALLHASGAVRALGRRARKLVQSASGVCLVVAPDRSRGTDVLIGRSAQRAWLALTEHGLAAQPMMSLVVLENAAMHGTAEMLDSLGRNRLAALSPEFRALTPECGGGRPAFLLRFGYAPPPSGRAGRLLLQAVTRELPLAVQQTGDGR